MQRFSLALCMPLLCLFCSSKAMASGDYECTSSLRLLHHNYNCGNNVAMLAPSNDTRVNLMLIMADMHLARNTAAFAGNSAGHPDSPLFSWDDMIARFGPAPMTDASAADNTSAQNSDSKCPPATPGDDRFLVAVKAEHRLSPAELDALSAARTAMRANCAGDETAKAIANAGTVAKSTSGKAFAQYLQGALYFWQSNYDKATSTFVGLSHADSPWVKEVALYMVGRTAINRAQLNAFDEYGSFKQNWKADPAQITEAETALDSYLRAYPKGDYAQSARGLKRRGYWLGAMTDKLAGEYGMLLATDSAERNVTDIDLAQEIDNKLLVGMPTPSEKQPAPDPPALSHDPAMLAVLDLFWMRKPEPGPGDTCCQPMPRAALEAQKQYFAEQAPLYQYLLACYAFYVENRPADVLHLLPDAARQTNFSYLQFSRQVLRGMALEALKDRNALGFWMQMLPGATRPFQRPALELAVAYHDERAGILNKVFDADSPVHDPLLREILLSQTADATLLRKQAKDAGASQRERDIALFTLLYKEASRGHAADFLNDLPLVPANAPAEGYFTTGDTLGGEKPPAIPLGLFTRAKNTGEYGCPGLRETETELAKEADDPKGLLCLGDFFLVNSGMSNVDTRPPADDLGGTPSLFSGEPFVRMQAYTSVLANPKASDDNKAYALYRAVNCYAPSGSNDCGGKDVPAAQRKAWFLRLKHDYPTSRWARELKYYW